MGYAARMASASEAARAVLLFCCLIVGVASLSCHQDGGDWTHRISTTKPKLCTGGAFCRAVTIKSLKSTQMVYLHDCVVTCKNLTNSKQVPKNTKSKHPHAVATSVNCCTSDGCNKAAPVMEAHKAGAGGLLANLAFTATAAVAAWGLASR